MTSRVNLDNKEAVVLHQHDYKNSSLIVHFFIKDYGKISAIAKGVKQSKTQAFSLLQPFRKVSISLTGKGELLTLKNIEATSQLWPLSGKSLYCAYYINELLLRLLPSQCDCRDIFMLYDEVLQLLLQSTEHDKTFYEAPLRLFELKLLEFLGYGLNLDHEIHNGGELHASKLYYYILQSGPSEQLPDAVQSLPISGASLINLAKINLSAPKTLQESKQLLKWALAEHLGDKPLKSRELFKQLYGQK